MLESLAGKGDTFVCASLERSWKLCSLRKVSWAPKIVRLSSLAIPPQPSGLSLLLHIRFPSLQSLFVLVVVCKHASVVALLRCVCSRPHSPRCYAWPDHWAISFSSVVTSPPLLFFSAKLSEIMQIVDCWPTVVPSGWHSLALFLVGCSVCCYESCC